MKKPIERDEKFEKHIVSHDADTIRSARMRYYGPLYDALFGRIIRSESHSGNPREMRPLHSDQVNERARISVAEFNAKNPGRQRSLLLPGVIELAIELES